MEAAEYAQQGKDDLKALAHHRGLPTSGTKEDLAARLAEWDTNHPGGDGIEVTEDHDDPALADLLALQQDPLPPVASTQQQTGGSPDAGVGSGAAPEDSGAPDGAPGGREATGEAPQALTEQHPPTDDSDPPPPPAPAAFEWDVELEAEFTDELHDRYRRQAHAAAVEAGKHPRVGPYGARLLKLDAGRAYYSVPVRRD